MSARAIRLCGPGQIGLAFLATVLAFAAAAPNGALASKPVSEKSAEACERLLLGQGHLRVVQPPSPSTLIPVSLLLGSTKCSYIPALWRWALVYAKQFPTPGLAQMYRTAETAADSLVEQMGIETVTPAADARNPYEAADATLTLMESKDPPEYIRKAVLIRDNVVVVVPILKRVVKKSGATGKPVYVPIVTKGHQQLQQFDILAAAFAGWALEPWQGKLPPEAEIFIKPMVDRRGRNPSDQTAGHFVVDIEAYLPQVREIYEGFMRVAEEASMADDQAIEQSRPERRCTHCNVCPWAAFCRVKLAASKDLSLMPLPPDETQAQRLTELGLGDLEKLAALDINGDAFVKTAMLAEVSPLRLRYYVAHALAATQDKVLVTEPFDDPTIGAKRIVHIDFEDLLSRRIRSGVYLFGSEVQAAGGSPSRPLLKKFIFAEKLDQGSVDEAWASFLRWLKSCKHLQDGDFIITMYSKHELVKIEQEFDVLRQSADQFSEQERKSPYYSETRVGDKAIGRLIRRHSFFRDHPDLKPTDVFATMDRTIDLLDYVRKNLAFPTYTNGIKHILKYVSTAADHLEYRSGSNGLESMAWAKEAYATGEPAQFQRIQDYNEIDIDANRLVADFLRSRSQNPVAERLRWDDRYRSIEESLLEGVELKRRVTALEEKRELLRRILGRDVGLLAPAEREALAKILDRSEYLKRRQQIAENKSLSEDEIEAILQFEKFKLDSQRQSQLFEFFEAINPEVGADERNPALEAMAELFSNPSSFLTPGHLDEIVALEKMERQMAPLRWRIRGGVRERLTVPRKIENKWARAAGKDGALSVSELHRLWRGLYYYHAYGSDKEKPK